MPPTKRPLKRVAPPPAPPDDDVVTSNGAADDDDEATPAPTMSGGAKKRQLRKGWSAGQQTMDSTSTYAQSFRPEDKTQVIKFLEDEPYANFRRHWLDTVNAQGAKTVRAYTCSLSFDEDCPLCEAGHKPQAVAAFNIAICGDDGTPTHKSWDCGARLFNTLKSYAGDPKIAPLTKGYFLVSKSGTKQSTTVNVIPVKASSLEEDYDVPPPDPDDLARLVLYDIEIVEITPRKTLRELAAELADYD